MLASFAALDFGVCKRDGVVRCSELSESLPAAWRKENESNSAGLVSDDAVKILG